MTDQIFEFSVKHCDTQALPPILDLSLFIQDAEVAQGIEQNLLFCFVHAVLLDECEPCVLSFGDLLLHVLDDEQDVDSEGVSHRLQVGCGEPAQVLDYVPNFQLFELVGLDVCSLVEH